MLFLVRQGGATFNGDVEHVGRRIRALRDQKGWTQTDLAARAGVSHSWVQKAEAAEKRLPSRPKFKRTADALGVAPEKIDPLWIEPLSEYSELKVLDPFEAIEAIMNDHYLDIDDLVDYFKRQEARAKAKAVAGVITGKELAGSRASAAASGDAAAKARARKKKGE